MLEHIFINVLNMSLNASYVIIFVFIARLLLKKAPKIFSYALWSVVLIRLLCPFSFESVVSLIPISSTSMPQNIIYKDASAISTSVTIVDRAVNNILSVPVNITKSVNPIQVWIFIGTIIWLCGILMILVYSTFSYIKIKRNLIAAIPLNDNIYLADHIPTPSVMGLFRPKIYLPSSLPKNEQEYIICHELCHIKRFDHITRMIGFIALAFHWFNPLVWLAFFLSGKDMEMSCDEAVMKTMNTDIRAEYSQSLLRFGTGKKMIYATPLTFGENDTKSRVKNILNYKKPKLWMATVLCILVIFFATCLLTNKINTQTIQNGTYSLVFPDNNIGCHITVKDGKFTFNYDPISSYLAYGNYQVKDHTLILNTDDNKFKYQFTIKENDLIFQERGSSTVKLIDERIGAKIINGSVFRLNKATLNDLRPMLKVNGRLYLDTGNQVSCNNVTWHGAIISAVSQNEKPIKDAQSNFGNVGTNYSLDDKGLILATDERGIGIRFIPEQLTHDQAVVAALTSRNNRYLSGECFVEGHIILGTKKEKNITKIYALTMVGYYGFQNDNFVKVSGSGTIPAVITLSKDNHIDIVYPKDGSDYASSIKKIFPLEYHSRIFDDNNRNRKSLTEQEVSYAQAYLDKIGRKATIGTYGDFEHTLLTHLGVSVEVSNTLEFFYKKHNNYPDFIGTQECIENDVRMVYELSYHESQKEIRFTKYNYNNKEVVEQFVFNSITGDSVALSDGA